MSGTGFTQEALIRLERAIAKGVMTVQYEDRRVTYRTLDEMIRLRDLMRRELDGASSSRGRRRRRLGSTSKGIR
ncbi:MAG: hypothetical protein AAFR54_11180 [Planctomycetota bacterium]